MKINLVVLVYFIDLILVSTKTFISDYLVVNYCHCVWWTEEGRLKSLFQHLCKNSICIYHNQVCKAKKKKEALKVPSCYLL